MKVQELIQKLSRLDPEAEVVFPQGEHSDLDTFDCIGYNPENANEVVLDWLDHRWECSYPRKPRELSESEKRIQAIVDQSVRHLAQSMMANLQYQNEWLDTPLTMQISMAKRVDAMMMQDDTKPEVK